MLRMELELSGMVAMMELTVTNAKVVGRASLEPELKRLKDFYLGAEG